jgi:prevent-host-death family protein
MVEQTVTATDARIHFGELMRNVVEKQQAIVVERGGKPHVVLLAVEEYERLKAADAAQPDWRNLVDAARAQIQAELGERTLTPPEEIIRQMREERSAQLADLR